LAKAAAFALQGENEFGAVRLAWSGGRRESELNETVAATIEGEFLKRLQQAPHLRHGVAEGLQMLHDAPCSIMVVTEGHRDKTLRLLAHHGLDGFLSRVLEAHKNHALFRRVRAMAGARPAFMVGDQLDRDIVPAKAAGLGTIYFPGGFLPRWQQEDASSADITVASFRDAALSILTSVQILPSARCPESTSAAASGPETSVHD
jgi:putative hydrolase of the HAD superfamily